MNEEENKSPCLGCSLGAKGINYCCPCINYENWLESEKEYSNRQKYDET